MLISKRKYYRNFLFAMTVISALIFIGALFANECFYHLDIVNKICKFALIGEITIIAVSVVYCIIEEQGHKKLHKQNDYIRVNREQSYFYRRIYKA